MLCYNFHPITREFLGATEADASPLEFGMFILPGYATFDRPPDAPENKVACYDNGEWILKWDYRGVKYWMPDKIEREITTLGDKPPKGASFLPPVQTEEERVAELADNARDKRDAMLREHYDPAIMRLTREQRMTTDKEGLVEIQSKIMAWDAFAVALQDIPAQSSFPFSISWPTIPA